MSQLVIPGFSGRTASCRQARFQPSDRSENRNLHREIKNFVAQRERAYENHPASYGMTKRKAVSRLKHILDYTRDMDYTRQRKYLAYYKAELLLLLPSERSRFQKLRTKILSLITEL